uniref:hypothetical protein n=1 Tax=Methylomonas sp. PHL2-19 TaxID=3438878 RepID=UPI00402B538C
MNVPVEVEVFGEPQDIDLAEVDHALSCSLFLPTGHLQVHECTGPERLYLSLPPGHYEARILFSGLASILDNGLDGSDRYRIMLWPGVQQPLKVLKQWSGPWRG